MTGSTPTRHGLTASTAVLSSLARRWGQARTVALPQGLALLPLTDALLDDMAELAASSPRIGHATVLGVPDGIALVASEASVAGPLAWLRRDEGGAESAVVWEEGRVVLGPLSGADALDTALRHLGAWARPGESVLDALGLRWTSTERLFGREG